MGHSSSVNVSIYQTPLAEAEILKLGTQSQKMNGQLPGRGNVSWSAIPRVSSQNSETEITTELGSQLCDNDIDPVSLRGEPEIQNNGNEHNANNALRV
jgi:hypothetical protein